MQRKNSYNHLLEEFKSIYNLETVISVLYWDMNTYMPAKGVEHRAELFNYLEKLVHEKWTSDRVQSNINDCMKNDSLARVEKRNVQLMKRKIEENKALPADIVGSIAKQSNKTLEVWKKAKHANSFNDVIPDMEKLLDLNIRKAELIANAQDIEDPFEALLGIRDPGFTVKFLTTTFDEVKKFLIPFIKKCLSSKQPDTSFLKRKVPRNSQVKLVQDLAQFLGYNIIQGQNSGRIDEVEHPLTIGCGPSDVRVTVKYIENDVMKAFSAGAHECGHALHSLQHNAEWRGLPVSYYKYPSFAESQSRILENTICGSREFWHYYYPRFQKYTDGIFNDISIEPFYAAINAVEPGPTRIGADEVTYCLHIIIRFEIEQELFKGNIKVSELPQVWNEKYTAFLGVEVPDDTRGVMQDLHWFSNYYGYFYGYAIGDLIASQIAYAGLSRDVPEWNKELMEGDFYQVKEWLATNVHQKGVILDTMDLVRDITGENLSSSYFTSYIKDKYSAIYGL